MGMSKERKVEYFARVEKLITTYSKLFVVGCDNVVRTYTSKRRASSPRGRGLRCRSCARTSSPRSFVLLDYRS